MDLNVNGNVEINKSMENFYCQQKCTSPDFSIEEWNKAFHYCIENNMSEKQMAEILEGKPCKSQCFDCMVIVGETRMKNKLIRDMQSLNRIK